MSGRLVLTEEERKARHRERQRQLYHANKEKRQQYLQANAEKKRQRERQYYQANKEKYGQYYQANKEKVLQRICQYRRTNHDAVRIRERVHESIRRACKANAIDPTAPPVTAAATARRVWLFGNCCAYCGSDGPLHLDHVEPLARGGLHTPDNLVPACQRCNLSKLAKPVEAWYLSQPFFSPDRWETLQAHTGRRWPEAEQLSLMDLLSA